MKHTISLGTVLFILWVLLSGHLEPLLLAFGVISVVFTLYISNRMDVVDHESHPIHLTFKLFKFWLILAKRIFVANIDVTLRILGIKSVEPQLIKVKLNQSSDLTKAMFANAITLTPGSASIHIEGDELYVHTISQQGAQDLLDGDMADIIPHDTKAPDMKGNHS